MRIFSRFSVTAAVALGFVSFSLLIGAGTAQAQPQTITFSNLPNNDVAPLMPYIEGNFRVAAASGDIRMSNFYGNPAYSIFTLGGTGSVQITNTLTNLFSFTSVDMGSANGQAGKYVITGFLGANQVFYQDGSTPPTGFVTFASIAPAVTMDRLVIEAQGFSNSIDNIRVNQVTPVSTNAPEPGSLALLLPALGTLGLVLRRKRGRDLVA